MSNSNPIEDKPGRVSYENNGDSGIPKECVVARVRCMRLLHMKDPLCDLH